MTVRQISTLYCCATCGTPVIGVRMHADADTVLWGPCKCDGWRPEQNPFLADFAAQLQAQGLQCLPSLEPAAELELPSERRL